MENKSIAGGAVSGAIPGVANPATDPVTMPATGGGNVRGITKDRGRWYFVKRVPRQFQALDRRGTVRIALHTDSEVEARSKAPEIERGLWAYWHALSRGDQSAAAKRFGAVKSIAEARGFAYRPAAELAAAEIEELVARLEALRQNGRLASPVEVEAVLGTVDPPEIPITQEMADHLTATADRTATMAEHQRRRYENTRRRTAADFASVVGDKSLKKITAEDATAFRDWWVERVVGGMNPNTANKQIGHLSDLFKTVAKLRKESLGNPFAGLRLHEGQKTSRVPFSEQWIRTKLAAPGALDGLNPEARSILLVMVNTGARPIEIINAEARDWLVSEPIPYLRIRARRGALLKTSESWRDIPLVGVSLEAAKAIASGGGCVRYRGDSSTWSATVGKYLGENGLREEPECTPYSLRHSFDDRLLDAGVDDRIRADLMGHKYARPSYGAGGRLVRVHMEIMRIAI